MGLNTYPSNPFPPSTDRMDADVLEAEVNKLESDVDQLKSGLINDSFNATANECFQIVMQSSHYITSKVVHICAKVKVLAIPDPSVVTIAGLPGGKTIINKGSTIPIYMASGEWAALSTIVYGYVSDYGIVTNKSDLVVGNYYYVDFIAKIS